MSWWAWLLLAIVLAYLIFSWSIVSFRKRIRGEFIAFLSAEAPDVAVVETAERSLLLRMPEGDEGELNLERMFQAIAALDSADQASREEVYRTTLGAIRSGGDLTAVDRSELSARLRVRIISDRRRAELEGTADSLLVARPLGAADLVAVVVIDSPRSVRYLTLAEASELGLDATDALGMAIANHRDRFPTELVSSALEGDVVVLDPGDGYGSTLLVLVPEHLGPGQRLLAFLPGDDGLVLVAPPLDPEQAKRIKGTAVQVTSQGFADPD